MDFYRNESCRAEKQHSTLPSYKTGLMSGWWEGQVDQIHNPQREAYWHTLNCKRWLDMWQTLVLASRGAPLSSSSSTAVSCPLRAAQCKGVRPSYRTHNTHTWIEFTLILSRPDVRMAIIHLLIARYLLQPSQVNQIEWQHLWTNHKQVCTVRGPTGRLHDVALYC